MSKAYDSRFEFNCNSINDFLSSTKDFQYLILYSTEAKRLEKEFQGKIEINKKELFRGDLFVYRVTRKL